LLAGHLARIATNARIVAALTTHAMDIGRDGDHETDDDLRLFY
jgi:hypothetical protein